MTPPEEPPPPSSFRAPGALAEAAARHDRPLGGWVDPPADPLRTERQWSAIDRALKQRGPVGVRAWPPVRAPKASVFAMVGGLAAAAALAFGVFHYVGRGTGPSMADAPRNEAPSSVVLADGSRVSLDSGATFAVPKNEPMRVETVLEGGGATFDVVPNRERSFTVVAESVEVRVVGTGFHVEVDRSTHAVTVAVDHGIVEVRAPSMHGGVRRLFAGETWSSADTSREASTLVTPTTEASAAPLGSAAAGSTAAGSAAAGSGASGPSAPLSAADDAKALFESANRARRAGDLARAASLYRELGARHPDDARAQVAALELARIEMDQGGDTAVAECALKAASSAKPGSSVHEDSLARLVALYAQKGDKAACDRARADYLAQYPDGVHVAQVRGACSSAASSHP